MFFVCLFCHPSVFYLDVTWSPAGVCFVNHRIAVLFVCCHYNVFYEDKFFFFSLCIFYCQKDSILLRAFLVVISRFTFLLLFHCSNFTENRSRGGGLFVSVLVVIFLIRNSAFLKIIWKDDHLARLLLEHSLRCL